MQLQSAAEAEQLMRTKYLLRRVYMYIENIYITSNFPPKTSGKLSETGSGKWPSRSRTTIHYRITACTLCHIALCFSVHLIRVYIYIYKL